MEGEDPEAELQPKPTHDARKSKQTGISIDSHLIDKTGKILAITQVKTDNSVGSHGLQ